MTLPLSLITYCMGRRDELERWLPRAVDCTNEHDDIVVVDYGDPDGAGEWAAAQPYPSLTVIQARAIQFFHVDHARNIGARSARNSLLIFCDVDMLLTPALVSELRHILPQQFLIQPDRVRSFGFLAVAAVHFFEVQGFEEAVCGYGMDDIQMRQQLTALGLSRLTMKNELESLGKKNQVRILQCQHISRNAAVNARVLRALRPLHRYKNNIGRNWGWGGTILKRAEVPPCSSQCVPMAPSDKALMSLLQPCLPDALSSKSAATLENLQNSSLPAPAPSGV